jgi:ligand-binding sensor domain-containing protein
MHSAICYDPYLAPGLADSCVYYAAQGWQHQSLPADSIKQMVIDREGNRWIQRFTGAIYRFKDNTWQQMRKDGIYGDIYINKKNEVWTTGIQKLDGDTWTDTPSDVSTWGDGIAVTEDRHGTMWFATYRGLVSYDGTSWKHYPRDPSEMPDAGTGMIVMTCDSADNIWLGSNNYVGLPTKGLHRFTNGTWHTHEGPIDSVGRVTAIATDCRGNVWVSSSKLFRFDGTEWTEYGIANSPVASAPSQLLVDADNTVWMSISTGILAYQQEAPVSVHETRSTNTATSVLTQNYPNPAVTVTSIGYELPEAGGQQKVKLTVWSALGIPVATLVHEVQAPGFYTVRYDTAVLPPGVYYYQLETAGSTLSRQMIVVR